MKFSKKDIFTIPNILTYIRLLCVPFFIWLCLDKETFGRSHVWYALGVFIFASVTDVVDGFIARKFNLVSDIGKVLDPLADKLLQMSAYICLTIIGFIHLVFPIIMIIKELYMIIGAAILLRFARKKVTIQSNVWGKLGTVFMAMAVFCSFFHPFFKDNKIYLDVFLFTISSILMIIAAIQYTVIMLKELKVASEEAVDEEKKLAPDSERALGNAVIIDVDESEIEVIEKNQSKIN